jgi:hypothetical protein
MGNDKTAALVFPHPINTGDVDIHSTKSQLVAFAAVETSGVDDQTPKRKMFVH